MRSDVARVSLAEIQAPVRGHLDDVYTELGRVLTADLPLINEVCEHLLRIKGKMFRPTLLLLSAKAVGNVTEKEITLAGVVELIHLATLLHDDCVDHSVLRRGQPTVNSEFSHEIAVIMGDFLYTRAVEQLVMLKSHEPLEITSRVTNELTIGEMREVVSYDGLDFSREDYQQLILAKTASLMAGACELGALSGGNEWREPLRRYGTALGAAFQIADDLLDYTATEAVAGKPVGQDLREHKVTLPLIAALPNMSAGEREKVKALMSNTEPSDEQIADVISLVGEHGGIVAARERALELAQDAEKELGCLPDGDAKDALVASISFCVERSR